MANKLISRINKSRTLGAAAAIISVSFFLSRVLGLVRDRLLATHFGIGPTTDAYTAAFRVPDLLFTLLVSGAFAVSFIPVFVGYIEKHKREEAWRVANIALTLFSVATIALSIIAFVFAPQLVHLIAPGFDEARFNLTVNLTRIMLLTPFLFAVSSVFGAIQQAFNRFVFFAMASVLYNLGIIIGIVFISSWVHPAIYGVAWGVVIGTAAQTVLQILGTFGLGYKVGFNFHFWHPGIRRIVKLMIPRTLDLGIDQLNIIVETAIGSHLVAGSLTSYYYANNLRNVPIGLFGGAIATAAFPNLIRAAKGNDKGRFYRRIVHNLNIIFFLTIPSAAAAIILRGYIVRLLFGFGSTITSNVLALLAPSIVATSAYFLIARVFYALEDTRTPLFTSIFAVILNIILSIILSHRFGIAGLATALSIVSITEFVMLILLLRRKIGPFGLSRIVSAVFRIAIASLAAAFVMRSIIYYWLPLRINDQGFKTLAPKFAIISLAGIGIYFICSYVLHISEAKQILAIAKKKTNSFFRKNHGKKA